MSKQVKKSRKKASPADRLPIPGPGRPKGSVNKFTNLKEVFLQAFEETGGVEGLVEWIKKSPRNWDWASRSPNLYVGAWSSG
jgi:hypothetical protein